MKSLSPYEFEQAFPTYGHRPSAKQSRSILLPGSRRISSALGRLGSQRAHSGPHHLVVFAGPDAKRGTFFVDYETIAGGAGARVRRPGLDSVRVNASGAANLPIEALENAYPLRVERYALRDGSGGKGRMKGGEGVVRATIASSPMASK